MKKETIKIIKGIARKKQPIPPKKVFRDKSKYSRKRKHKAQEF